MFVRGGGSETVTLVGAVTHSDLSQPTAEERDENIYMTTILRGSICDGQNNFVLLIEMLYTRLSVFSRYPL